jgi:serine/threonine-protein kinase
MDASRWLQISRIYHAAVAQAESERHAFLEAECGGDEGLRRDIESLLANGARAEQFLTARAVELLAEPKALGGYRIERLLGHGGMGMVFLAYDTTLHRQVAVKVMGSHADSDTSRAQLLREARNAAALNHPNICTIYEVGEANGAAFIAMEYVEGRALSDRVEEGPLPLDEALRYAIQAADALAFAHDHGVVHRDFKAANTIISSGGWLKVVDFGLARRADAMMTVATTMVSLVPAGTAAGTPYAMAPEQVRGESVDPRTDVWALGVLLYEMVTGAKPFAAATTPDLFSAILRDDPRPLPDDVPRDVRAVVDRCLAKVPEQRYAHAGQVRTALAATQPTTLSTRRSWRRAFARRRALLVSASVATVTVALGLLNPADVRDRLFGTAVVTGPTTLAVLPLENHTGDPAQEYLSDGVTDAVIASLSRLNSPRLNVIARTSSIRYKQSAAPLEQIGRELDANTVLKGSVARSGNGLRIDAELIRTSDARSLWRETYERSATELAGLENDLTEAVSTAIGLERADTATHAATGARAVNAEAYDLYLRGLSHAFRYDEQDLDQAIALFEQSAAVDPTFVPTHAYLAMTYGQKSSTYRPNEPQWEERGFAAVQKALKLDPESPEAHYAQGMMLWRPSHAFPSREALQEFRRALTARPNFDEAWHQHAVVLFHVGHLDAAAREIQNALRINPSNTIARFRLGPIYVYQLKFEDAIAALDRVPKEAFPAQWTYQRAWALISLGRMAEAGRIVDDGLKDNPADQGGVLHSARAMLRAKRGDRTGAEADVAEAIRVGTNFIHFHHTAYAIGAVYTVLGDFDKAQEWIERAANDGFPNYTYFEKDVHLTPLRATPRFRAFLAKLRMEWEHIPGEPD